MLQIKSIRKTYGEKEDKVEALRGVTIDFRQNEFVSILGPSGCGKTTLLNIIGGLDQYTSGDLIINGKTTKDYKDKDWDNYRNHSVGFVFQSYNLISHQSILSNVELALTVAGISRRERRKRAKQALNTVGLEEKISKKPTELSGGQMQRVAIARALVGNPDIILADEPTGALDSTTSLQIMDLLKEISKEKLVIMVTHNADLAKKYSTRTIQLLDGKVTSDSNPYKVDREEAKELKEEEAKKKEKKPHMSFATALTLSSRNLLTKKGRTALTSFAGSIGIIGIALIMSLSNGIQHYIDRVEEETLSSYPITIEQETIDISSMMETMMKDTPSEEIEQRAENTIYSYNVVNDMLTTFSIKSNSNNLKEFKKYIEQESNPIKENSNAIQYEYDININLYTDEGIKVNPSTVLDTIGMSRGTSEDANNMSGPSMFSMMSNRNVWRELLDNDDLIKSQYNLVAGDWPTKYNEVVIMANKNGEISDYTFYTLGLKKQEELKDKWKRVLNGEELKKEDTFSITYDELLSLSYKLVLHTDYYLKENNIWINKSDDKDYMNDLIARAESIKVVGIIQQNDTALSNSISGGIGYLPSLTSYVISEINNADIVKEQKDNPTKNIFSGLDFPTDDASSFDMSALTDEQKYQLSQMSTEQIAQMMEIYKSNDTASYEYNLKKLGSINLDEPSSINIYAKDFEGKENISKAIEDYNKQQENNGKEENIITYTDFVGVMVSSVQKIVDIISYVLIAFVAISLVVSSIMISIITYISVLERTKEIGILRAIGASKKDVSRVFNAETFIEGFISGTLGIVVTLLLSIPINIIGQNELDVKQLALLPIFGGLGLIILSIVLTLIAGLVPSRIAAKRDPVVALRTE
ncbi:ABC transporter ATP-binding protein/permease [bacterium]|nr:ABC transporter ATP-binding protein/permease [bacterium]